MAWTQAARDAAAMARKAHGKMVLGVMDARTGRQTAMTRSEAAKQLISLRNQAKSKMTLNSKAKTERVKAQLANIRDASRKGLYYTVGSK